MKKYLQILPVLGLAMILSACGDQKDVKASNCPINESNVVNVGATPVPAAEILEVAKEVLAKDGITLKIQSFTDYLTPNVALSECSSDANMYQHKPFMDNSNIQNKTNLVALKPIYVVPLGFYSHKFKSVEEIPNGATIALPNDPTNNSRALILLHDNGVIKLKDSTNLNSTELDIEQNPKNLVFKQVEAAMLPKVFDGVDGAVINANYALQAGMSIQTSFFHESDKSAYVNVFVAREDNKDSKLVQAVLKALTSDEVRDFITTKYKGEIIPAF